jgi:glycine/D-amino acid oxidase-like deaminating enzyme
MKRRGADAIVVGAGSFGASIAFHLASVGKSVVLLDKAALISQTSPRAAGLTMQIRQDPTHAYLAKRSVEKIEAFQEETGEQLDYRQSGSLKLTRNPNLVAEIEADASRGWALGLESRLVSHEEARRLAPFLNPDAALATCYTPSDLYLTPADLLNGYVRASERLGVTTLPDTAVTSILVDNDAVAGVITDKGLFEAPVVVDTGGAWNGVIAAMAGVSIPTVPMRHQLLVTRPIDGVSSDQPIVRIADANVYVRPEQGGLLFGGYEPDPLQFDADTLSSEFTIDDLALDASPLLRLMEDVAAQFPTLGGAGIAELRGGLPTMTADGRFIIDRATGVEGFFVATGCCVGGLSTSPAVGEVMARWIVEDEPGADMSPFSLERFANEQTGPERLRRRCLQMYAEKYVEPQQLS